MTLQTAAPIQRLPGNPMNEPVEQVARAGHRVDSSYQRGLVWGTRRKALLVKSLLMGIHTGEISLNRRDWDGADYPVYVIDGQQRLAAVKDFLDGHVAVPASWFGVTADDAPTTDHGDGPYVRVPDLPPNAQGRFTRCSFSVRISEGLTREQEAMVFELVNFAGVPQGQSDPDAS